MDYLSGMPLDYQSEIKRLERAQLELIEAMDEAAKKKLKRRRGTAQLNTKLSSGLNIPATSSGINVA